MEQKYVTVEKDGKTYVRRLEDVQKGEHISGIFLNKIKACNIARRNARRSHLEYVPVKNVKKGDKEMAVYNVVISSRVSYSTEVEAGSEGEAKEKALRKWHDCDVSEMEFWDTHVDDVYQD